MQLSQAIKIRTKLLLKEKNMNLWRLNKSSGIPISTLSTFFNDKKNRAINLKTLLHLCEGLDVELKEFFDDPIFLDVEQD